MHTCERCGTSFGRPSAVLESCPRCLVREGVRVRLAPKRLDGGGAMPRTLSDGLEEAVRERLASTAPEARRPGVGGLRDVRDAA
jgi:predicted  nucleic acid-binding Zn-ribbon protein